MFEAVVTLITDVGTEVYRIEFDDETAMRTYLRSATAGIDVTDDRHVLNFEKLTAS